MYTLLYDPEATHGAFADRVVKASWLSWTGVGQRGFRRLLPLYPLAVKTLDARRHELVITSSSAFAHGVRVAEGAQHVCYCHTPFRYAWFERERALAEAPSYLRPAVPRLLELLRRWDVAASRSVDHYIANSVVTRQRILEAYGREATVVHPPVDVDRFSIGVPEDFFLVVGELVAHKRMELALEAARRARRKIVVVGDGPERDRLADSYGATADFVGRTSEAQLADLYSRAAALLVPGVEEFGIAAVEAQAAGRPVVAANAGGARETVIHEGTGLLVQPDDPDALAEALTTTDFGQFSPERIREHAQGFSTRAFKRRFVAEVRRLTGGSGGSA